LLSGGKDANGLAIPAIKTPLQMGWEELRPFVNHGLHLKAGTKLDVVQVMAIVS
jgi:hypothetical protein